MIREWIKRRFGLYDMADLTAGAHCGCCGEWMEGAIVPKYWCWGLCQACIIGAKEARP